MHAFMPFSAFLLHRVMVLLGILMHYVTIEHPASESSCGFRVLQTRKVERAFCRVLETARDFRLHCSWSFTWLYFCPWFLDRKTVHDPFSKLLYNYMFFSTSS